jgi:hypothetical protein
MRVLSARKLVNKSSENHGALTYCLCLAVPYLLFVLVFFYFVYYSPALPCHYRVFSCLVILLRGPLPCFCHRSCHLTFSLLLCSLFVCISKYTSEYSIGSPDGSQSKPRPRCWHLGYRYSIIRSTIE